MNTDLNTALKTTLNPSTRLRKASLSLALGVCGLAAGGVHARDTFEIIFNELNRAAQSQQPVNQSHPHNQAQSQIPAYYQTTIVPSAGTQLVAAVGGRVRLSVVDRATQSPLAIYLHKGEYWVAGSPNQAYALNLTSQERGRRALAVASVDGINVVSGEPAGFAQRGYVLSPFVPAGINGWRKNEYEIATFNFGSPQSSYAAQTGRPANLGVIGVALFPEYIPPALPPVVIGRPRQTIEAPAMRMERHHDARPGAAPAPGLGTQHGQREESHAAATTFNRESASPTEIIVLRYDTVDNLIARGILQVHRPIFPATPLPNPFPAGNNGFVPDPPGFRR